MVSVSWTETINSRQRIKGIDQMAKVENSKMKVQTDEIMSIDVGNIQIMSILMMLHF